MTAVDSIAIIGLGLMGGSLGLALVRAGYQVTGWDQNPEIIKEAYQAGAINRMPKDLMDAVGKASVVFIATPVESIAAMIKDCLPLVRPGTIFTDLGSIKTKVLEAVFQFLPESQYFVAGHPMTGSEQHGLGAADPFLFQNAAYLIIEDPRTPSQAADLIIELVESVGAQIIKLTAAEHDRIVSMVSHLPHLIAATLAKTAGTVERKHPGTLGLAAGGFRDTTRVALGSPEVWRGIIRGNLDQVIKAIDTFQAELINLKEILTTGEVSVLDQFLTEAQEVRRQIPAKNKGFLSLLHEMVVTIEDRPGTIVNVLRYLADVGLNIKDIEILRVREGTGGTLRLALESDKAVNDGVKVLESHGFKVKKR
ncbi:MAG: prephenate dehydrogenase/arogenate dehydrogenase family protein [Firmicutes bacterium]|nr:prephenate dehydrogenase/arogenate dehydrogenase family protein [Bacillota bacterium]